MPNNNLTEVLDKIHTDISYLRDTGTDSSGRAKKEIGNDDKAFIFNKDNPAIAKELARLDFKGEPNDDPNLDKPAGPLTQTKLVDIVEYKTGGIPKLSHAAGEDKHIGNFKTRVDGLLKKSHDTLKEIQKAAGDNVQKLLTQTNNKCEKVTQAEWVSAFQDPLKAFEAAINIQIEEIKATDCKTTFGYTDPGAAKLNKDAQVEALEQLKTTFRTEVEKQQNDTLLNTIQTTKFKSEVAAGNMGAGPARLYSQNQTLAKHAQMFRLEADLKEHKYAEVKKEGRISAFNEREIYDPRADVYQGFKKGKYETRYAEGFGKLLKSRGKEFTVEWDADGSKKVSFKLGGSKEDLGRILDAFFAGKEPQSGTLSINGKGKVNYKDLMQLAEVASDRRYKIKLDDGIIANLRNQEGMTDAAIQQLGARFSGNPQWQIPDQKQDQKQQTGPRA